MPGLNFSRKPGESFEVSGPCKVTIAAVNNRRVTVNVQAAPEVVILRSELVEEDRREVKDGDTEDFDTGGIPQ